MNTHIPQVTVLLTVYNGQKYLDEAIKSILNQTFEDFEFLIINDGSSDRSKEIALSYQDQRIKVIDNPANLGTAHSSNLGLKLAKGEFIARLDSDDISIPVRLEKQLRLIKEDSKCGIVCSWVNLINRDGKFLKAKKIDLSPEDMYYWLNFRCRITHSSVFYRKDCILAVGGYDNRYKYADDYDLWLRVSKIKKIKQNKEVLVEWRDNPSGITSSKSKEQNLEVKKIILNNLWKITGRKYPYKDILLLADKYSLNKFSSREYPRLFKTLKEIHRAIIAKTPGFLDKKKVYNICLLREKHFKKLFGF